MGELVRFPGATVDHESLDNFEWTDDLLRDYAARARALADRYGKSSPLTELPRWRRGECQDCKQAPSGKHARRYRIGRYLLCSTCASSRLRVRASLGLLGEPPADPTLGTGEEHSAEKAWREKAIRG